MGWQKNVDELTRRRVEAVVSLDDKFLEQFSRFFGDLCKDERYIKPTLLEVPVMAPKPQLSTFQVYNALSKIRKTSTTPEEVPFRVWKEYADILTPPVEAIWNLSLSTQQWLRAWKEANITPFPKVDFPVNCEDFRGIGVTPVIVRAFERTVYNIFNKRDIESRLGSNQFTYRTGGSCTNALIKPRLSITLIITYWPKN